MFDDNGSFLLALFEFFIFVAWFMCLWWIFGDVFRSRDLGGFAKTIWVLFIIVLPFLGILVYLIARGHGMTERAIESQKEIQRQRRHTISICQKPVTGLAAHVLSKTVRCASRMCGAPSMVSFSSMYWTISLICLAS